MVVKKPDAYSIQSASLKDLLKMAETINGIEQLIEILSESDQDVFLANRKIWSDFLAQLLIKDKNDLLIEQKRQKAEELRPILFWGLGISVAVILLSVAGYFIWLEQFHKPYLESLTPEALYRDAIVNRCLVDDQQRTLCHSPLNIGRFPVLEDYSALNLEQRRQARAQINSATFTSP